MAAMTTLGAMRVLDRARWLSTLRKALTEAGGRLPAAAEALGVSVRQLSRWLAEVPELPRATPGRPAAEPKPKQRKRTTKPQVA